MHIYSTIRNSYTERKNRCKNEHIGISYTSTRFDDNVSYASIIDGMDSSAETLTDIIYNQDNN